MDASLNCRLRSSFSAVSSVLISCASCARIELERKSMLTFLPGGCSWFSFSSWLITPTMCTPLVGSGFKIYQEKQRRGSLTVAGLEFWVEIKSATGAEFIVPTMFTPWMGGVATRCSWGTIGSPNMSNICGGASSTGVRPQGGVPDPKGKDNE